MADVSPAPFGRRAAAFAVDTALAAVLFGAIAALAALIDDLSADNPTGQSPVGGVLRVVAVVATLTWAVWNGGVREGRSGQSVGKRLLDLTTVDPATQAPLGTRAGAVRFLVKSAVGGLSAGVLLLWPLWDKGGRSLPDKAVSSVVASGVPVPAHRFVAAQRGSAVRVALRTIALGYVLLLVAWPVALVATNAFENGFTAFVGLAGDPEFTHALQLTVIAAIAAVVVNTVFGISVSLLIVRYEFPGKRLLNALLDIPLSVSPIVVGLALVLVYGSRDGWLGEGLAGAGVQIIWALPGIVLATAFVSLPLVIREVVPVLKEIGTEQEQAAFSLGASSWQAFWRITLPAIKWGVVYGVVLTLARSLGEFGAVKIVSGNISEQTRTATLVVEERYLNFDHEAAYAISFILASISVVSIIVVSILRARAQRHH
ncbi:MAG: sulfate ABC transporter permease subunit [Aeromicrobium sp.]|uniref:sulfate ABC transporter permease subunit n=1 Tax=Aeromicrobium sp. TaxID=1871063 RepID=UPI0039E3C948